MINLCDTCADKECVGRGIGNVAACLWHKPNDGTAQPRKPKKVKKQAEYPEIPLEHEEQIAFFKYIGYAYSAEINHVTFAIPNGGLRHKVVAGKLKAEGVKPGVPDIMCAVPCGEYHGLYIEMKRLKGSVTSAEQLIFHERLRLNGYCVAICNGWLAAKDVFDNYHKLGEFKL